MNPTCWICLESIGKNKSWTCPECKSISHRKCLIEYLSAYDFNRIFCATCQRVFTNKELRELLTKKNYRTYINKAIIASMDHFMLVNMARVNETLYYMKILEGLNENDRRRVTLIAKAVYNLKTNVRQINANDELLTALRTMINNEIDISTLQPIIDPEVVKLAFTDDPAYSQFIHMPVLTARYLIFKNSYTTAYDLANAINAGSGLITPIEKKPKPFMNCSECGGLVLLFHKRAYCSSCQQVFCRKCGEKINETVNTEVTVDGYDDEPITQHECKDEDKESFKTIMLNTKPCPKCGVRIQKSFGCSQMFCTRCHTGFDWNTGEIIVRNFHNPHRNEWLAQLREQGAEVNDEITIDDILNPHTCVGGALEQLNARVHDVAGVIIPPMEWRGIIEFVSFITHLHDEMNVNQEMLDLDFEGKCMKWLSKGKNLKTIIKIRAGASYCYELLHERVETFIDCVSNLYLVYIRTDDMAQRIEMSRLALDMVTQLFEDLVDASIDCGKSAVFNSFIHISNMSQYLCEWYAMLPGDDIPLSEAFTKVMTGRGILREAMMRTRRNRGEVTTIGGRRVLHRREMTRNGNEIILEWRL